MFRKPAAAAALLAAGALIALPAGSAATTDPGHVQADHTDVCTVAADAWQAGLAAYNVQHGGTIPTPGDEWNAGPAPAWTTLTAAQQQKWEDAALAAIRRACHPIVP